MSVKNNPAKSRPKARFKKWFMALVCVAVLGAGGWYFWHNKSAQQATASLMTITVQSATIEDVVTAQGKLEPRDYVDVGAQVSGQLEKIHFELCD